MLFSIYLYVETYRRYRRLLVTIGPISSGTFGYAQVDNIVNGQDSPFIRRICIYIPADPICRNL